MRSGITFRFLFAVMGLALVAGCSGGDSVDRCVVSGIVNFDGKPLPNGEIRFRAESGPLSGSPIKDGKYTVDHNGGVPLGKHDVTVTAYRIIKSKAGPDGLEIDMGGDEQYIPEKYNKKSTLNVLVDGKENPAVMNFDLEK